MRPLGGRRLCAWFAAAALLLACDATPTPGLDAGPTDAGPLDAREASADAPSSDRSDAARELVPKLVAWDVGVGAPRCGPSGWCWESPAPVGGDIVSVSASAPDDGWALTRDGLLIHASPLGFEVIRVRPYDPANTGGLVWAASPTDVWISSRGSLLRWDGSTLRRVLFFDDFLEPSLVWGTSSSDVWVAGVAGEALHFDGTRWERRGLPNADDVVGLTGRGAEVWAHDAAGRVWRWRDARWIGGETRSVDVHRSLWVLGPNEAWSCSEGAAWRWDGTTWTREVIDRTATSQRCVVWSDGSDVWFSDGSTVRRRNSDGRWDFESETLFVTAAGSTPEHVWIGRADGVIQRLLDGTWVGVTRTRPRFDVTRIAGRSAATLRAITPATVMAFDGVAWFEANAPSRFYELLGAWPDGERGTWLAGLSRAASRDVGRASRWSREDGERDVLDAPLPLRAIAASAPDDVWAVGDGGAAYRFNGSTWAPVATGVTAHLRDVWVSSRTLAWAVGERSSALRWDGERWSNVALPLALDLTRVHGSAPDDVWAIGTSAGGRSEVLRWNGDTWGRDTAGLPSDYTARGIWAAPGQAWIAGDPPLRRDARVWNREVLGADVTLRAIWGDDDGVVRTGGSSASIFARRTR